MLERWRRCKYPVLPPKCKVIDSFSLRNPLRFVVRSRGENVRGSQTLFCEDACLNRLRCVYSQNRQKRLTSSFQRRLGNNPPWVSGDSCERLTIRRNARPANPSHSTVHSHFGWAAKAGHRTKGACRRKFHDPIVSHSGIRTADLLHRSVLRSNRHRSHRR